MLKTILICGASRGIGKSLVSVLAKNNNLRLWILTRNTTSLKQEYRNHDRVTVIPFDLEHNAKAQLQPFLPDIGPIHALINNSGHLEKGPFKALSMAEYRRCMQVNFFGPVELIQTLYAHLLEGKAHVVNISTMGAYQGSVKFPELTAYAASKAALTNFTEVFAEEQKDCGIRMNCLCLGAVNTEMLRAAFPGYEAATSAEEMAEFIADFTLKSGRIYNGKILPVSSSTP
ncbi:MAG: SDR family oxidoreductase [Bacteroidetes bacterium]|nr:SDR family oxidoreductase [Bacteroidota bacterium]